MTTDTAEDLSEVPQAGRTPRNHPYGIQIGDQDLTFRAAVIADPVPTGRQVLEAAGALPTSEHLVFQVLGNGLLEELRPDETTDLRVAGVEKFLVFRSDRSFRFDLDGRIFEWGAAQILGLVLKKLAGVNAASHAVWQDSRGGKDKEIDDSSYVSMVPDGTERFYTALRAYTIIVNTEPKVVQKAVLSYIEVVKLAYPHANPSPTMIYTVTYKKAVAPMQQGSLVAGDQVTVKNGTIFNVTETDKS